MIWIKNLFKGSEPKEIPVSSHDMYTKQMAEYAEAIKPYLGEPIHTEYITDEMVRLCLQSLEEQGRISFGASGREKYLNMKGGWTPTIAYDVDPVINHRKAQAAFALAKEMGIMWDTNVYKAIKAEAVIRILKTYQENSNATQ